ncbi:MAG TPA: galactosyltransferase-related protein [Thermoanaerobaculia bacterium]|nr:galactosyltransferase-related protein [Thermoanaerobaculia bacterium]
MSLRQRAGALIYDWPRFALQMRRGRWVEVRNRDETITTDARGVRCEWRFSSDLHIAKVFPPAGERLMRAALRDWPVVERDAAPAAAAHPEASFIIGHRGISRLPHLLRTLRSIAGQSGAAIECIVVEQSAIPEIESTLPHWVRYIHTPTPSPSFEYARAWAFNVGARIARAPLLILQDNDLVVPERYAAEAVARAKEGWSFLDLKRFVFYLDANGALERIAQNLQGGTVIAARDVYFAIGGFDESFVGWGGEDNDFRERAEAHGGVYGFGYLPFVHLFHEPQQGKLEGDAAPAVRRYREIEHVPATERIARLRAREIGNPNAPPTPET